MTTLVRVEATNVYLDKIKSFIVQYVSGTRWKRAFEVFCFIKSTWSAWSSSEKSINI